MSGQAAVQPAAVAPAARTRPAISVMVVDDSAVIRSFITRALSADPDIVVPVSASNGRMAIDTLARHPVDLAVLDIEMPIMDGLTALPEMLAKRPGLKVIVASTLTARNADISLQALRAGAADYILKPGREAIQSAADFNRDLIAKVKSLCPRPTGIRRIEVPGERAAAPLAPAARSGPPVLRPLPAVTPVPELIVIGSSTGGPQALFKVLGELRGRVTQPILITQHMPATFTALFADHINRTTGFPASEARDGQVLEGGHVYVAPGDFHMRVTAREDGRKVLALDQGPQINFCRPSVDPMFQSASALCGARLLAVILTGMGQDGLDGSRLVVQNGGTLIAQDEATSVVWGMPGAVAKAGLCNQVLPLPEISASVVRFAAGGGR
jgi:two-component system chemotaxis response regulator CheB